MTTSGATSPTIATHPVHTVHRIGIAVLGLFLLTFGVAGLSEGLDFHATAGSTVMGLQANGLLAAISVAAALVLLGAAARGGRTASTVGMGFGVLFLLSGLGNVFLIGTTMNMLAFGLSNVIFSLLVGMGLLFVGAYGRVSGGLPPDSPYYHDQDDPGDETEPRTAAERATDRMLDAELAEAERAVALHYATPRQAEGVRRAAAYRTPYQRRRAYWSV